MNNSPDTFRPNGLHQGKTWIKRWTCFKSIEKSFQMVRLVPSFPIPYSIFTFLWLRDANFLKNYIMKQYVRVFSRVLRDTTPRFVCPSVGRSVGWLVGRSVPILLFLCFCSLWPHCSCPNPLMTSNVASAHTHATGAALCSENIS